MSHETVTRKRFERRAMLFMALVCGISLLAIIGWVFNLPLLASFRLEFIPMAPSTAVIFLGLSGAGLLNKYYPARRGMKFLVQASLMGMLMIVLILALRYFVGLGPDLEQMLIPNPLLLGEIETARISPLTALGFILAIPAFLLLAGPEPGLRTKNASAALLLAVFLLSGLIILGYLYGVPLFYGGTLIPVAFTTALSFMFLSLGLLLTAGPACWPVRMFVGSSLKARLMRTIIPASIIIVLLQGLFSTASAPWIVNPALRVAIAVLVACLIFMLIIYLIAQNLSTEIECSNQARLIAENTLFQSEARFRTLIETASDAIINIDHNGHIVLWNRSAETIFGYSAGEAIGKPLDMIMPEGFHTAHQQGLNRVVLKNESHIIGKTVEMTGLRKDGHEFPLALSLAIWQVGGDFFFTGIIRDITERKQAEEVLRAISYRQQILLSAVPDIIMEVDNNNIYTWANQPGQKFFGKEVIGHEATFYFDSEQGTHERVNPLFEGVENIVYIENWQRRWDGQRRLLAWWCHILKDTNGNVTGTLSSARDITEQWLSKIALINEHNLLVTLMDNVPDMIYFKDLNSRFIRVNQTQARRLGLNDPAQLIGKTDFDLFEEEHARAAYEDEQAIIRSGQPLVAKEEKETFLDGHTLWVSTTKMPLRAEQGQIVGTFGISRDITDSKKAEEALRESEERFRSLYENVSTGIYRTSPDGRILMANSALVKMLGYETFEELAKRDLTTEGYEVENLRQEFRQRIEQDGEVRGFESAWKCKNGSIIYVRESAHLAPDERNQTFFYEGTVEDITVQRRAEEALRKSESSLQAILQSTADGILAVGIENDVLYTSERFAETWSIPTAVLTSKDDGTLLRYVLDQLVDSEVFLKKVQELYKSKEESFDTLNFKDGRVFERQSRPMVEGEVILGRVWSFHDITERKRLEEEIRSLSLTDQLTGLNNRRGFTLLAEQEVKLAHREKRSMLLCFGDLDNLKAINDGLGHEHGDLALKEISAVLKQTFRESDILARIGGDEFVVLALDASKESAEILTNRIHSALEERNHHGNETSYRLSLSLGIARYNPDAPCTVSELIAQADGLMYQQKQARKGKM